MASMKAGSSPECVTRRFADLHESNKSEQKSPKGPKCGRHADQLPAKSRIESGTHPPDAKPAIKETIGSKHTLTKKNNSDEMLAIKRKNRQATEYLSAFTLYPNLQKNMLL